MKIFRERITYANIMATAAMFIALGLGSAYAADKIGSKDISRNAVKSKHIGQGQVKAKDLARTAVKTNVTVHRGGNALAGTNGASPGCVDGVPGESKGYNDAGGTLVSCGGGSGGSAAAIASCPAGKVATGGGYSFAEDKRHALVAQSRPEPSAKGETPTGWFIRVETLTFDPSNNTPVRPYVICAAR